VPDAALLACAGGLHRRVQCQDVGLKGNAIDHANDVGNATRQANTDHGSKQNRQRKQNRANQIQLLKHGMDVFLRHRNIGHLTINQIHTRCAHPSPANWQAGRYWLAVRAAHRPAALNCDALEQAS